MANKKHEEILKQGVKVWNKWRRANSDIIPDLSGSDLSGASLKGVDLIEADLSGANLRRVDLSGAYLVGANFFGANLRRADLSGAYLVEANFIGANLIGAKLKRADLSGANVFGADLSGANLSKSYLVRTIFEDTNLTNVNFGESRCFITLFIYCDLSKALQLSSVKHEGPSTIAIDTILKSKGKIPVSFLKGCGVPDDIIRTMLPLAKGRQFYTCFISFSSKDEIFAEKLKKDLEKGDIQCWFFPEHAVWGKDIEENIDRAVRDYDKLIVICSENSLNSEPVLREIDRALKKERSIRKKHKATRRVLFPVIIDEYFYKKWKHPVKPLMLKIVYGDFRDLDNRTKYKKAFDKLLEALQK